jgi:hypothetical protein
MGRISRTFRLMGESWAVLKQDRELLLFPVLSSICSLAVIASFAAPLLLYHHGAWSDQELQRTSAQHYGLMFTFYFINFFIATFFNAAIVACAARRMEGHNPTLADGLSAAFTVLHLIFAWAVISATVGLVLRMIEERAPLLMRLLVGALGMLWSVATFLVVPVLVIEGKGPFQAIGESASLLKRTWGEQIVGNFSFGVVFFLLGLPGIAAIALGAMTGLPAGLVPIIAGVVYLVLLGLVNSALHAIYQAAVYRYAVDGEPPAGFSGESMQYAMRSR